MLAQLTQILGVAHDLIPYILGLVALLLATAAHRRHDELEKAHAELAKQVDDTANSKTKEGISALEEKVSDDDKKRLEAEALLSSESSSDPKPRG